MGIRFPAFGRAGFIISSSQTDLLLVLSRLGDAGGIGAKSEDPFQSRQALKTADGGTQGKAERRKNLYAQKNHYSEIKT
jgi:hypothetical protein